MFGVLGCGVDVCYPREHIGLYTDIQRAGGLLSEYPPGTPPLPAHFPVRNRIISGLADQVLVMEAREKSAFFPKSIDQLQDETTFAPGELLGLWTALELKGCAREVSKNYYVRVP